MFKFIKLPNKLFYTTKNDAEGEKSILKSTNNDKTLLAIDFLYSNVNRKDKIKFTLENMITECGFKPSTKAKESNDQFKNILSQLKELEIIHSEVDFSKIKPKELIICTMINWDNNYFELYDTEKEKILTYNKEKINNLKLLIYYCYLKARMYKRAKVDGDLVEFGGRAETCNPSYKLITLDLGIVDESIKKYNDILISLDMIRIGSAGNYYYNDDPTKFLRESSNIYSLYLGNEEGTKNNLKEGIKLWKSLEMNSNKVFTDSKMYKNNNRQLNGQLGAIVKKEKNGTATEEDIKRKNEILNITSPDEIQHKISAILDSNKGELLSQIYYEKDKYDDSDKYLSLEKSLGLINEEEELLVNWDYYKWAMANYKENQHQYYVNCVAKKIKEIELINKIERKTHLGKAKPEPFKEKFIENFNEIENEIEIPQGYNEEESWDGNEEMDLSGFMYEEDDLVSEEVVCNNDVESDVFSDYFKNKENLSKIIF